MMLLILAFLCVATSAFLALEFSSVSARQVKAQLKRAGRYAIVDHREKELGRSVGERLVEPMIKRFSEIAMRVSPQGSRLQLARKLQAAGSKADPQKFLAVKGGLTVGGLVFGLLGALVFQQIAFATAGLAFSALSFIGPDMYLGRKAGGRRDAMERGLPDTLDLLTVSVEAGLGFDSAVAKVCEKMNGPLIDELEITAREIRIGSTRRQALRSLGERVNSEKVQSFTRSIIQAEELGTSLGRTLKVQADDMRIKRQLEAEEKAMKAPVKMLFPTVMFIFPAMFIVILGPAFLNIVNGLKGATAH